MLRQGIDSAVTREHGKSPLDEFEGRLMLLEPLKIPLLNGFWFVEEYDAPQ